MTQTSVSPVLTLDVHLTILERDHTPAAHVPVRLVLGSALTWQSAEAGHWLTTAEDGTCARSSPIMLDDRRRRSSTNFFANFSASRARTRHLQVALEMEYAARPWLTAIDVDRFQNGVSTQVEPMRVYGRAANGRFTDNIPLLGGARQARLPKGGVVRVPGFDLGDVSLDPDSPDADAALWTLRVTLTRW